ncbi:MAG: TPM domain-containing protein [Cytophagaceae bacterium]|nr:TPM domain-containing protein [Cytophagaceae bacterium]
MRIFLLNILFFFISTAHSQHFPERIGEGEMINDYAYLLSAEEEEKLEVKVEQFRISNGEKIIVALLSDVITINPRKYASSLAAEWHAETNTVIIVADVKKFEYAIYRTPDLNEYYPDWIIEKIEHNHIRVNFREKKYFKGLDESINIITGLRTGKIDKASLKQESGGYFIIVFGAVLLFFLVIFPFYQFYQMRNSFFNTKPVDLISSVLLLNKFGMRGKNMFDDFSRGSGKFTLKKFHKDQLKGGGGIGGSW